MRPHDACSSGRIAVGVQDPIRGLGREIVDRVVGEALVERVVGRVVGVGQAVEVVVGVDPALARGRRGDRADAAGRVAVVGEVEEGVAENAALDAREPAARVVIAEKLGSE
jgi:hypothetical protein